MILSNDSRSNTVSGVMPDLPDAGISANQHGKSAILRVGVDMHVVDGKFQGSRTHVLELFSAAIVAHPTIEFYFFLADPQRLLDHAPTLSLPNVKIVEMPTSKAPIRLLWQLPRLIKQYQLDIIHTQYIIPRSFLSKCLRVVTIHDILFETHPQFFQKLFTLRSKILFKHAAKHAHHVFTVSNFSKQEILRLYKTPAPRVSVIYNGVDTSRFNPTVTDEQHIQKVGLTHRGYILSVGRLEPRKNQHTLIKAYAQLTGDVPPLVLIGQPDFNFTGVFDAITQFGLEDRVKIISTIDDDALPSFYRHALFFIYPTLAEGFGMPPLEAMACGTPVITSNNTALPEVVGAAGILIDPDNIDDIAKAMRRMIEEPELRSALMAAGLRQAAGFSWEVPAIHIGQIYRKLHAQSTLKTI